MAAKFSINVGDAWEATRTAETPRAALGKLFPNLQVAKPVGIERDRKGRRCEVFDVFLSNGDSELVMVTEARKWTRRSL